jgi:hypothetical protein
MTWRAARSLLVLQRQLQAGAPRARPPATPADAWGLVGDAAHDPTSDHTPHNFAGWGLQIVTAADFPNRPDLGLDAHKVLDDIRKSRDPRVKYGISNGQQFSNHAVSGYDAWTWRPYGGDDQHYEHGHLSVVGDARADGEQPWATIGGNDMEQKDPLIAPWQKANVGNALAVTMESREALVQDDAKTGYGAPAPASMAGRIRDIQAKVGTLATGGVDQDMINAAVKVALTDPAVIGPLVKAIGDDSARRQAE